MNLIFRNGERLYLKQHSAELIEKLTGTKLHIYQKEMINQVNSGTTKIYGDDFLIEFIPENIEGEFVLSIRDYDENQNQETEINISFNEQELSQLISQLSYFYEVWTS